jgi:hypothetical protein
MESHEIGGFASLITRSAQLLWPLEYVMLEAIFSMRFICSSLFVAFGRLSPQRALGSLRTTRHSPSGRLSGR